MPTHNSPSFRRTVGPAWLALALVAGVASGQSTGPAAFVANNGNVEGSVSAFTFAPSGAAVFVGELNISTNPQTISLTPSGRFVATAHGTASDTVEALTIMEVGANAALTQVTVKLVDDSPLNIQWIDNEYLAVTHTSLSETNELVIYRFDDEVNSLTEVDRKPTGNFSHRIALHPTRVFIYAQDSSLNDIHAFSIGAGGTLTLIETQDTGTTYPLDMAITNDGTKLYAAGGISNGGNKVQGFVIESDGSLTPMAGSPFTSPGASPAYLAVSRDDKYLYVGHGTDATCRAFTINPTTGQITATGYSFDVGLQGTLGDLAVLANVMLITDESTATDGIRGLYSFTIQANGSLVQNGAILDTQGVTPESIAVWLPPRLVGDVNCDGSINGFDIDAFTLALSNPAAYATTWPLCDVALADVNADGSVNGFDVDGFVDLLGG